MKKYYLNSSSRGLSASRTSSRGLSAGSRLLTLAMMLVFPLITYAFMCPTNFNQIDFGMTPEQVKDACGDKFTVNKSIKKSDNIPQEWNYYIPQAVSLGGNMQNMQGTLKTTITFDENGKAINISVNGIGVGASTICGPIIQLGDNKDAIKRICGSPAFVNKQTPPPGSPAAHETQVLEYIYKNSDSALPDVSLIFEDGKLTDKK